MHALRGVSLTAAPGELVAVRGRSGSGKTTLLNVVGGLDRPDAGRVVLDGADVTAMSDAELLARAPRHGRPTSSSRSVWCPILTARENVGIPLRLNEVEPDEREDAGRGGARARRPVRARQPAARVSCPAGSSSGWRWPAPWRPGPALLLADEPTGQLDSETGREIMMLIARLAKEETMTTVVTTHDPVLLSIADRVVEIVDGHLVGAA